jgi:hypothetical protein
MYGLSGILRPYAERLHPVLWAVLGIALMGLGVTLLVLGVH